MSRYSALPPGPERHSRYPRRDFLWQLLGASVLATVGVEPLFAGDVATTPAGSFRFAFLTDLHLMQGGALRSADGIAACLAAVEKLSPRPEFILCGGDLVHSTPDLSLSDAADSLDLFLQIWSQNTSIPTHWTFGNHDLAGTKNLSVPASDPRYGKGLFQSRLKLPRLFYSFDCQGWHFIVLDDIALEAGHYGYFGQFFDNELAFLKADLDAHRSAPTIVCTHIPIASFILVPLLLGHDPRANSRSLVCTNGDALLADMPGHNIRAVLAGHLHFHEEMEHNGIPIINSGAVCANYWKGPNHGCPEGFGVVDVGADGSVKFDYRGYGWKA